MKQFHDTETHTDVHSHLVRCENLYSP